uniref:Uncharacterized protein n=1 Tax=Strongyloides venezuelensis TaxID=75913 RepID=A0A0K0G5A2_STRVS
MILCQFPANDVEANNVRKTGYIEIRNCPEEICVLKTIVYAILNVGVVKNKVIKIYGWLLIRELKLA